MPARLTMGKSILDAANMNEPHVVSGTADELCEMSRTRLIRQISLALQGDVPADARQAGLTLIGWLARRLPGEPPDSER